MRFWSNATTTENKEEPTCPKHNNSCVACHVICHVWTKQRRCKKNRIIMLDRLGEALYRWNCARARWQLRGCIAPQWPMALLRMMISFCAIPAVQLQPIYIFSFLTESFSPNIVKQLKLNVLYMMHFVRPLLCYLIKQFISQYVALKNNGKYSL